MTRAGTLGSVPPNSPQASGLRTRIKALIPELGKFGLVGGFAFTVDFVLYNLLLRAGAETLTAKATSTVIATTIAFLGNRFWTWRDGDHTNMARQYTTFFVLNAIGLGIALACLGISHYGLGQIWPALRSPFADNISGVMIGTALGTLFRFWSYRRFVFRAAAAPVPAATPSPSSQ
ncbi:GtrA family protein [Actinoplanes hulinensis]|uniref:GtrA family protein n=1 Tax=Actinoplanes hulinensis TaxID=1144547 RepID=A0ABS7AWM5_9ACTN|nr:GtrA family protein [Actinoplanes hulinensis]